MVCQRCGRTIDDGQPSCPHCGQRPSRPAVPRTLDGAATQPGPVGPETIGGVLTRPAATADGDGAEATDDSPGQQYRLLGDGPICEGAEGEIWSAWDTQLGTSAAVKLCGAEATDSGQAALRREALLGRRLSHKNLCRYYGFHSGPDGDFAVLEPVEGRTLAAMLRQQRDRCLPWAQLRRLADQVAAGLDVLAEASRKDAGEVRRARALPCVRPQRVFVSRQDGVKLPDLLWAGPTCGTAPVSAADALVRFLRSCYPSDVRGRQARLVRKELDALADRWGFGNLLDCGAARVLETLDRRIRGRIVRRRATWAVAAVVVAVVAGGLCAVLDNRSGLADARAALQRGRPGKAQAHLDRCGWLGVSGKAELAAQIEGLRARNAVEERARMLLRTMEDHLDAASISGDRRALADLRRLAELGLDDRAAPAARHRVQMCLIERAGQMLDDGDYSRAGELARAARRLGALGEGATSPYEAWVAKARDMGCGPYKSIKHIREASEVLSVARALGLDTPKARDDKTALHRAMLAYALELARQELVDHAAIALKEAAAIDIDATEWHAAARQVGVLGVGRHRRRSDEVWARVRSLGADKKWPQRAARAEQLRTEARQAETRGDYQAAGRLWDQRKDHLGKMVSDAAGWVGPLVRDKQWIHSAAFSPAGDRVALGDNDNNIQLWDAKTGRRIGTIPAGTTGPVSVMFSPDGRLVSWGWCRELADGPDRAVQIWDSKTGRRAVTLKGLQGPPQYALRVAFSPTGRRVVTVESGSKDPLAVWKADTGQRLWAAASAPGKATARWAGFSQDGRRVLCQWGDGKRAIVLKVHNADDGKVLVAVDAEQVDKPKCWALSGKTQRAVAAYRSGRVVLWDLAPGGQPPGRPGQPHRIPQVRSLSFLPDGQHLAIVYDVGGVAIWDTATAKYVRTFPTPSPATMHEVEQIGFSPDGKRMAILYGTGLTTVWDVASAKIVASRPFPYNDAVQSVSYSPDGKRLLVMTSSDVCIFDAVTLRCPGLVDR